MINSRIHLMHALSSYYMPGNYAGPFKYKDEQLR